MQFSIIHLKKSNPLYRSGLLLAGANCTWNGIEAVLGTEDGILTAAEVSLLDLSETELVVLSACETGLGEIKGNEGVYGFQRAFKMAGVDYLILSLWQVPDKETQEFMIMFYKYLTKAKSVDEAFTKTVKKMQKIYPPFCWAAFVLIK
jgi:CHAT domain-containing protein